MSAQRKHKKTENASRSTLERVQVVAVAVAVFVQPLVLWPTLTDYNYAKSIVSLILISILLILWGLTAWRRSSWTIRVPWLMLPVAGFVLAGLLSLIQATNGRATLQSLLLLIYFVLLLWMIANVIRDQHDVRWLLTALLASGTLAALYGVLQYCGILPGSPGMTGQSAIISSMGNRNYLGGFLLYLFYPAIIVLIRAKARWLKAIALTALMLTFFTMLLVKQEAARTAFVLVSAALAVGWLIFRPVKPIRTNRWWLVGLTGAILTMLVLTTVSIVPALHEPVGSPGEMWEENSGAGRAWIWWIGAEMLADHPLTGVGVGNYKIAFLPYKTIFAATERGQAYNSDISRASHAHNDYVQAGAEFGAVGLLMLVCSLGALAISLWIRLKRSSDDNRLDLLLVTAGILAFLAHGVVSFPAHLASSSLLLIVFCGLALSPRYGDSMTFRLVLEGWKGKATHSVLAVIAVTISLFAIADLRANWLMERGLEHLRAGLHAAGEELLQQSLALDFAPRQTYYYLALAQIQLGRLDEAEENLEKCMTRFLDERVFLNYAELEIRIGDLEKAQDAVDVLLASHHVSDVEQRARYIEAVILIEQQQYDQAIESLESLTQDHASFDVAFVALGQLYVAKGLTVAARRNFETALQIIAQKLGDATAKLESATSAETRPIRAEIETLVQQRDHVISQLANLP
ncbi:O-antigen ligase family protein [Candidatus Bipolaricaulota bacterium]